MATGLSDQGRISARIDQEVVFRDVPWALYQSLVATRGERSVPRITYFEGELELMSPSTEHERLSMIIHDLIRAFAESEDIELDATGSWTVRNEARELGIEADQSYVLGDRKTKVPDLAVEVIWTHGSSRKLEVYAGLGVPEVWLWRDGRFEIYVLGKRGYAQRRRSRFLPTLDLELLAEFVRPTRQLAAVREYRSALTTRRRGR